MDKNYTYILDFRNTSSKMAITMQALPASLRSPIEVRTCALRWPRRLPFAKHSVLSSLSRSTVKLPAVGDPLVRR